MKIEITNTRRVGFGQEISAGDLRRLLDGVPDQAMVRVDQTRYNDPREAGIDTTMTVNMVGVPAPRNLAGGTGRPIETL